MKKLLPALALALIITGCTQKQTTDNEIKAELVSRRFWQNDSVDWQGKAPDDTAKAKIRYGISSVYYFTSDSSFRKVDNMVETQGSNFFKGLGTYESIYEGSWKIENHKIVMQHQLLNKSFLPQLINAQTGEIDTPATIKLYAKIYRDTLTYTPGKLSGPDISLKPATLDTTRSLYKLMCKDWTRYRERIKNNVMAGGAP